MTIRLEVTPEDEWADRATERWAAFMTKRPDARLCLPTGDTPRPLYALSARSIDFSECEVFLLDEFDLPPGDPARCDTMLERDFLARLASPPIHVETLDVGAADADRECRRFERLVDEGGLDLTLLGLGGNGHLGLNEPGSTARSPTRVVHLTPSTSRAANRYGSGTQPTRGMTLGMRPILESEEIWLLVTGSNKASILERMLSGPIGPDLPASFLRNHPNTVVLTDRSAATLVQ